MSAPTECAAVALWAAGLCAVTFGNVLLAALPRNREGCNAGLVSGIGVGMFVTTAWYVSTACGVW